ncbi:MAG: hypothetical protein NWE95_11225 [Candidatus Bathyarchaeota archaeon]|nr:hypothetical protein [Candidatus Bathyarchaeota archaeon]
MRKTTLLVISLFATVLLSSALFSVAAAQEEAGTDEEPNLIAPAPDSTPNPDVPEKIAPDENSTITQDDKIYQLYQDGRESADDAQVPGAENEANLIATNTGALDNTLPLMVGGVLLAVAFGGVTGIVYYRKS